MPKPRETATCNHCGQKIEWASLRSEEGWPYSWRHMPSAGQSAGDEWCKVTKADPGQT